MYKKVLAAVDLTEASASYVLERARPFVAENGELFAVHIVEPQYVQYSFDPTFTGSLTRSLEADALAVATKRLDELCSAQGIDQQHQRVFLGRPADKIHDLVEQEAFDLIITGSHGQEGIRLLLGSTANAVLHGSPVDVATIRMPKGLH